MAAKIGVSVQICRNKDTKFIKKNKKSDEKFAAIESLKRIKGFLNELKANL